MEEKLENKLRLKQCIYIDIIVQECLHTWNRYKNLYIFDVGHLIFFHTLYFAYTLYFCMKFMEENFFKIKIFLKIISILKEEQFLNEKAILKTKLILKVKTFKGLNF